MNKVHFKDSFSNTCLLGGVVASWFVTQVVEGSNTAFLQKIFFSNSTDSVDSIEFI